MTTEAILDQRRDAGSWYTARPDAPPIVRERFPHGEPVWVVRGFDMVSAILKDLRFSQTRRGTLRAAEIAALPEVVDGLDALAGQNMLDADQPAHTRLRGLVHRAFTPRLIQELRPRIQQIADDLIDAMQQRGDGQIELIDEFAFPLPVIVIAELLGLPPADRDQFRAWTTALTQIIPADDPRTAMVAETALEFTAYLADLFDQRRAAPRDDLISGLVQARDQGDTLSEVELHSTVLLLLVAGHETTVNLLGNSVLTLLQHPQQLAQLRAEPDHMEAAVEELLRFCGPVHSTMRFAREPVVYGGHTIARGEGVLLLLPTANRDPQRHTDSDTFDITRVDRRHLSFGQGIHFCLGAPLARLEAQIALTTLFRRFPDLALGDGVEQGVDDITFGVRRLPLRYSEARGAS